MLRRIRSSGGTPVSQGPFETLSSTSIHSGRGSSFASLADEGGLSSKERGVEVKVRTGSVAKRWLASEVRGRVEESVRVVCERVNIVAVTTHVFLTTWIDLLVPAFLRGAESESLREGRRRANMMTVEAETCRALSQAMT